MRNHNGQGVTGTFDTAIARAAPARQQGQQGDAGAAHSVAKPIGWPPLLPGDRCGCSACTADADRDHERRDVALMTIVYDLGVAQLRAAALERMPAFRRRARKDPA